jgi:hypothetical protein
MLLIRILSVSYHRQPKHQGSALRQLGIARAACEALMTVRTQDCIHKPAFALGRWGTWTHLRTAPGNWRRPCAKPYAHGSSVTFCFYEGCVWAEKTRVCGASLCRVQELWMKSVVASAHAVSLNENDIGTGCNLDAAVLCVARMHVKQCMLRHTSCRDGALMVRFQCWADCPQGWEPCLAERASWGWLKLLGFLVCWQSHREYVHAYFT